MSNNTLAFLESEQSRQKALSASVPAADDPNLYRWSEASDYVRLPKSLFTRIQIYDPAMDPRKQKENGPEFSPALAKDGRVSSVLLDTLGLDASASARIQQAFGDFARAYRELEKSHTSLRTALPKGFRVDEPHQTLVTSAFPEEGKLLETRLRSLPAFVRRKRREATGPVRQQVVAGALWNGMGSTRALARRVRRRMCLPWSLAERTERGL